jgi:hypothetical protein
MSLMSELTFDPSVLSAAQRSGDACIVCHKQWPRPSVRVGRLPDGAGVFACADCAPTLPGFHATEPLSDAGSPAGRPVPAGSRL